MTAIETPVRRPETINETAQCPRDVEVRKKSHRFALLDSARGLAILAVLCVHFLALANGPREEWVFPCLWKISRHGSLGVELFFLVSGYCISLAAYQAAGRKRPALYFITRRFRRIFPPYWAGMLLYTVLGLMTVWVLKKSWHSVFPLSLMDWLANGILLQGLVGAPDLNLVFWSLSVELQFYLTICVCLLFGRKNFEWILFSVTMVMLIVSEMHDAGILSTSISLVPRWPSFALGISLMYSIQRIGNLRLFRFLGMFLVLLGLIHFSREWSDADGAHISLSGRFCFCFAAFCILRLLFHFDAALARNKAVGLLSFIGVISYSLYLVHIPIGTRFYNGFSRFLPESGFWWLFYFLGASASSFIAAYAFHVLIEKPFINHPTRNMSNE